MTTNLSPRIVISGSGIWTPSNIITNDELVESYNAYAEKFNSVHA
jgi:beta-ketodecanoyl-[acyl-carrier-protein] synthase